MRHARPMMDMSSAGIAGLSKANTIKLAVAVVALLAAGVILASHFGVFGGGSKGTGRAAVTPAQQQEIEQQIQEQMRIEKEEVDSGRVTIGGA